MVESDHTSAVSFLDWLIRLDGDVRTYLLPTPNDLTVLPNIPSLHSEVLPLVSGEGG